MALCCCTSLPLVSCPVASLIIHWKVYMAGVNCGSHGKICYTVFVVLAQQNHIHCFPFSLAKHTHTQVKQLLWRTTGSYCERLGGTILSDSVPSLYEGRGGRKKWHEGIYKASKGVEGRVDYSRFIFSPKDLRNNYQIHSHSLTQTEAREHCAITEDARLNKFPQRTTNRNSSLNTVKFMICLVSIYCILK